MALPSSGQLAISQISDEFGGGSRSNVSLRSLSSTAGLSVPDGFNEFYGLSAYTPPSYVSGANSISGSGTAASPYIIAPRMAPVTWSGDSGDYCSWLYGQCMYQESANCAQPDPQFQNQMFIAASSTYNYGTGTLKFNNNFTGAQRAVVTFQSANINFNSAGYTGFSWSSNQINFNYNQYAPSGNVWSSIVNGSTVTGGSFTKSLNEEFAFGGGFTQWSFEAIDPLCSFDEYSWEVYVDVPSAYYKLSLSNYVIRVYFEPL